MKRFAFIVPILFVIVSISACSSGAVQTQTKAEGKPVKTITLNEEKLPELLKYFGTITYGEVKKMSFKSFGRIGSIPVEKGQAVEKGTVLARLDAKDLQYAVDASRAQVDALDAQLEAAERAYENADDNFKKASALLETSAISRTVFDDAKLNFEVRKSDLNRVKDLKAQAMADYGQKTGMLDDSVMVSDMEGFIVDVLYQEGEIAPAGYPVIIIRNSIQKASVGLSQKDAVKVIPGMKADLEADDMKAFGIISSIAQTPDSRTHTYNTEITVDKSGYPLGAAVQASIITGELQGIWIPISSILSGGKDYVFVAENGRAVKKDIVIENINGSKVKVKGLESGQQLIVEGAKMLKHMDLITIQQ